MSNIKRNDIIGQKIQEVYVAEPHLEKDGYGTILVYIKLESQNTFRLPYFDESFSWISPEILKNLNPWHKGASFIGAEIIDILRSEYWATLGLFLSTNYCIGTSVQGTPGTLAPFILDKKSCIADNAVSHWPTT